MASRHLLFASTATWLICSALSIHAQTPPAAPDPHASAPTPPSAAGPTAPAEVSPTAVSPAAPTSPAAEVPAVESQAAPAPATSTPTPSLPPPSAAGAPRAASDGAHARLVLRTLAERDGDARIAGAYSMFISGAAAITAGVIADAVYDRYYGKPLWIIGALVEVGGLMSLFRSGTFERLARDADGYSAAQLQSEWSQRALLARKGRRIGGAAGLVLGGLAIGTGAAIAAGLGELKGEQRQDWTTALIAFGGGLMGSGVVSILVESPLESGYRSAYGNDPDGSTALTLNVAPTLGGAALHLSARF